MKEIKISPNPYETKIKLYKERIINLKPGLTVLVGCNGCGKSTLIKRFLVISKVYLHLFSYMITKKIIEDVP